MMKRFVALILVLAISMSLTSAALADSHTCDWYLQSIGIEYRDITDQTHSVYTKQIALCRICGAMNGYSYALEYTERHQTNDTYVADAHSSSADKHIFYERCNICSSLCYALYVSCSGANGIHVSYP